MLLIKNTSKRKVYINDIRVLLQPQEMLDMDVNENFAKSNFRSNDMTSLIESGNLSVLASDKKDESKVEDVIKADLKDMLSEILSDLLQGSQSQIIRFTSEDSQLSSDNKQVLDIGEINAAIHSQTQIQDALKNSRINIKETDIEEDVNTDELVELLRKQKEGANNV